MPYSAYKAIADPTRRQIIDLLASHRMTVNMISDEFSMSRQAVTKHLRLLESARLVMVEPVGRERWYTLNVSPLKDIYVWMSNYSKFWDQKLNSLGQHLDRTS